jgi:integrase/recombinase XerD
MPTRDPCLLPSARRSAAPDSLVERYLQFVASRARPNTVAATESDLRLFFAVVDKVPAEVTTTDVLDFIAAQRRPRRDARVVRLVDGEAGLALSTIKRRLASVSGLFGYLVMCGELERNPVPRGLATRRRGSRGAALIRTPRLLPKVLSPAEVDALFAALRTWRDRAMVEAMVLGGLRRCEVLGIRFEDLRPAESRLFVAEGKGGHQRLIPASPRFFRSIAAYLDVERPDDADGERVFVALKGPRRGYPLSADGLDEIVLGARRRAGLAHATCHELRHTCFTRLREAGMALEAVQSQAGHRSIESTRIYLHLSNEWLAGEYIRAAQIIDAARAVEVGR